MKPINIMQETAIWDTLDRLNSLYGHGKLTSVDHERGIAWCQSPQCKPHSFIFRFDGTTVRALSHQSRLKGLIHVEYAK